MKYLVLDQDVLFGGKSFLVCGDLCQLPPVRAKPVFIFNENKTMERFRCWIYGVNSDWQSLIK